MLAPLPYSHIALRSAYAAFIASLIVYLLFPDKAELGASALCGLELRTLIDTLLTRNRIYIWKEKLHPAKANSELALQLLTLFGTVFVVFGLAEIFVSGGGRLTMSPKSSTSFPELYYTNFVVLTTGILLSLLFSGGGLLLILNWYAFHWSTSLVYFGTAVAAGRVGLWEVTKTAGSWLPFLGLEVIAICLSGLGAVFLSKALRKYELRSVPMKRVAKTALLLIVVSFFILAVATLVELSFATSASEIFID
ncbi:MAG: hypothetical protein KDD64_00170 [Bdellovibrionales bacterium]|nr:hypothetical protein [Bdellovibrionales bacterium]